MADGLVRGGRDLVAVGKAAERNIDRKDLLERRNLNMCFVLL